MGLPIKVTDQFTSQKIQRQKIKPARARKWHFKTLPVQIKYKP